jgi:hypothetical protein
MAGVPVTFVTWRQTHAQRTNVQTSSMLLGAPVVQHCPILASGARILPVPLRLAQPSRSAKVRPQSGRTQAPNQSL